MKKTITATVIEDPNEEFGPLIDHVILIPVPYKIGQEVEIEYEIKSVN